MPLLFQRRARVLLQTKAGVVATSITDEIAGAPGLSSVPATQSGIETDSLHLKFKAEKNNQGTPNTLELTVYNFAASTRKRLQSSGAYVKVVAGYQSDWPNLPVIFEGNARTVDHLREGPDWVTRIQCGDGETAYRFGYANKSWSVGVTSTEIATYLAQQVQTVDPQHIDISQFTAKIPSLVFPQAQFAQGYAVFGNAFGELQKLLGARYELTLQEGRLTVMLASESTGKPAFRLAYDSGLLGSPEHGTPNADGLPQTLKAKCLLNGRIGIGDLVFLETQDKDNTGVFRVQKLTHTGDLAGQDWQTELELLPVGSDQVVRA